MAPDLAMRRWVATAHRDVVSHQPVQLGQGMVGHGWGKMVFAVVVHVPGDEPPAPGHLRAAGVLQEVEQGGSPDMLRHADKAHDRLAQQHWQQPIPHRRRPAPNHCQSERHVKCGMGPCLPDHGATFTDRYKAALFFGESTQGPLGDAAQAAPPVGQAAQVPAIMEQRLGQRYVL